MDPYFQSRIKFYSDESRQKFVDQVKVDDVVSIAEKIFNWEGRRVLQARVQYIGQIPEFGEGMFFVVSLSVRTVNTEKLM